MRLTRDPVFGEVDLRASRDELAGLADAVTAGTGHLASTAPASDGALAGIEVRQAPGPGVLVRVDAGRNHLVISGDAGARALLADNLRAMATTDDGGHLHIDPFPGHPYLAESSVPLVVSGPLGGMPHG
ncbi:hypothetical protein ACFXAE_26070 [Streptomyces sp. NPDC059454]|uniref:Imm32 family immunity protein n=1 Tax=Streptomyces sp. NPDC059454 TaxID=3346836 RepID=UPI00368A057F